MCTSTKTKNETFTLYGTELRLYLSQAIQYNIYYPPVITTSLRNITITKFYFSFLYCHMIEWLVLPSGNNMRAFTHSTLAQRVQRCEAA